MRRSLNGVFVEQFINMQQLNVFENICALPLALLCASGSASSLKFNVRILSTQTIKNMTDTMVRSVGY